MVVQELGWDEDVDEELRNDVMDVIEADLVEDAVDAVDAVMLWHRGDADVGDALLDVLRDLSDAGWVWLFTPKLGRPGYVELADIAEGARVAGLSLTSSADVSRDWQARKVVRPRSTRRGAPPERLQIDSEQG